MSLRIVYMSGKERNNHAGGAANLGYKLNNRYA